MAARGQKEVEDVSSLGGGENKAVVVVAALGMGG